MITESRDAYTAKLPDCGPELLRLATVSGPVSIRHGVKAPLSKLGLANEEGVQAGGATSVDVEVTVEVSDTKRLVSIVVVVLVSVKVDTVAVTEVPAVVLTVEVEVLVARVVDVGIDMHWQAVEMAAEA